MKDVINATPFKRNLLHITEWQALTILKGIPRLFHKRWKMKPNMMRRTGTKARDQPSGIPQSSGRSTEKLTRGFSKCSCDTLYRVQLRPH